MMKPLEEQTHYEVLDIPANAAPREIQKAYGEVLSIYDADALSTYSLFSGPERERILGRAKQAFRTLMDPAKRRDYDAGLVSDGRLTSDQLAEGEKQPEAVIQTGQKALSGEVEKTVKKRLDTRQIKRLARELQARTSLSGQDLKSLRQAAGVELDEIFQVSRVSVSVLDAIENDRSDALPSLVFLKGFLRSYADFLNLDPKAVIPAYLNHLSGVSA